MNAIQTKNQIDFYNNLTSVARFPYAQYGQAVNSVLLEYINEQLGDEGQRNPRNFEWIQRIRDNMYPLIKTSSPTISNGSVVTTKYYSFIPSSLTLPTDYNTFISLDCTISGITGYARPTTYNELGPLLEDSFKHPTNEKYYFLDNTSSITVWRGSTGNITSALLTYIKIPNSFSIGSENQRITTGGTLTNASTYYAIEVSVYNGTTYQSGASITGTGAALTSGLVILTSNTTPIELPDSVHDMICRKASAKMLLTIGQYDGASAIESEVQKG